MKFFDWPSCVMSVKDIGLCSLPTDGNIIIDHLHMTGK